MPQRILGMRKQNEILLEKKKKQIWFISSFYCWSPLCILFYISLSSNKLKKRVSVSQIWRMRKAQSRFGANKFLWKLLPLCKKGGDWSNIIQYFVHWLRFFSSFFVFFFRLQLKFLRNQVIAISSLQVQCVWQLFFIHVILVDFVMFTFLHFPILLKLMNVWDYFPIPSNVSVNRKKNWYSTSTWSFTSSIFPLESVS